MIKNIIKILAIVIVALLQITLMPYLAINGIWPNLVLIAAILLLLFGYQKDAFYMAGIGGIILDLTGILPMGLNTIFLISLVFLIKIIDQKYFPDVNALIVFITVFISSIISSLLIYLFLGQLPELIIFIDSLYGVFIAEIIYFLNYSKTDKMTLFKIGAR